MDFLTFFPPKPKTKQITRRRRRRSKSRETGRGWQSKLQSVEMNASEKEMSVAMTSVPCTLSNDKYIKKT